MSTENVKRLAIDLTRSFPRSPRETLGGYVHAARMLDKCRATIAGCNGEYHYDCPLDAYLLEFTGITADAFRNFVATGATDDEVAAWIAAHSQVQDRAAVVAWNNRMRCLRLCDIAIELQVFLEGYIPKFVPKGRPVTLWFDVYDLEEGRG